MEPDKIKHMEFIQSVITRMNTNSFQLKGWTITIVSALLALYASTKTPGFIIIGGLATLVFWLLDTYYLTQERKFRGLYDDVAGISEGGKVEPFSMNTQVYDKTKDNKYCYWRVFMSKTIGLLYLPLVLLLIFLWVWLK